MEENKFIHIPVLLNEIIEGLNIKPNGTYVDMTLGRAGHFKEVLKRLDTGLIIGIDQDQMAIDEVTKALENETKSYRLVHSNFDRLPAILDELGIDKVDGIYMDLGVSSPQFDDPTRGFSYRHDAYLDMRMDQRQDLTAAKVLNTYSLNDLTRIFREYGDEKYAYSIAKNIVKAREKKEITSTLELVEIIKASKPMKELKKIGHPAKQVFQALRIEVNDELTRLKEIIRPALKRLKVGGRLLIITFHSGEDRIVKTIFKDETVIIGNRLNIPDEITTKNYCLVNKHPIIASDEEMEINPRSKSAKLRIIEKIS